MVNVGAARFGGRLVDLAFHPSCPIRDSVGLVGTVANVGCFYKPGHCFQPGQTNQRRGGGREERLTTRKCVIYKYSAGSWAIKQGCIGRIMFAIVSILAQAVEMEALGRSWVLSAAKEGPKLEGQDI